MSENCRIIVRYDSPRVSAEPKRSNIAFERIDDGDTMIYEISKPLEVLFQSRENNNDRFIHSFSSCVAFNTPRDFSPYIYRHNIVITRVWNRPLRASRNSYGQTSKTGEKLYLLNRCNDNVSNGNIIKYVARVN